MESKLEIVIRWSSLSPRGHDTKQREILADALRCSQNLRPVGIIGFRWTKAAQLKFERVFSRLVSLSLTCSIFHECARATAKT